MILKYHGTIIAINKYELITKLWFLNNYLSSTFELFLYEWNNLSRRFLVLESHLYIIHSNFLVSNSYDSTAHLFIQQEDIDMWAVNIWWQGIYVYPFSQIIYSFLPEVNATARCLFFRNDLLRILRSFVFNLFLFWFLKFLWGNCGMLFAITAIVMNDMNNIEDNLMKNAFISYLQYFMWH